MLETLGKLAEAGVVGICIAVIILFAYFMRIVFKLSSNHLQHLTDALNNLASKVEKVVEKLNK